MKVKLTRTEKGLALVLPAQIIDELELTEGQFLRIGSTNGRITLEPYPAKSRRFLTENELLSGNIYTAEDQLVPEPLPSEIVD